MTESMVEKVARALHRAHYERGRRLYPDSAWDGLDRFEREMWFYSARAAIEAMREPTDEMVRAAIDLGVRDYGLEPATVWGDIIDAALSTGARG